MYSKRDRLGLLILVCLTLLGIVVWKWIDYQGHPHLLITDTTLTPLHTSAEPDTVSYPASNNNPHRLSTRSFKTDEELLSLPYEPRRFDPNTASMEEMIQSGVPLIAAKRIIKYRNKGGKFYQKEKLKNFGLSEQEYQKVSPYVHIAQTSNPYPHNPESQAFKKPEEPSQLHINTATEEELMKFKGIGPTFSRRIVNYRNKLGGFIHVEQLKEVYGLPDSTYLHISPRLVIDETQIRRISVNEASEEELAAHPYIGPKTAAYIVRLRQDLGGFKNIDELRQVPLINAEKYRKLVPYLKI